MPRCCITKYLVDSLEKNERPAKPVRYYDEEIREFFLEYRGRGRGSWYFRYMDSERRYRYYRIGSLRDMPLPEARAQAYSLHNMVLEGGDPHKDMTMLHVSLSLEYFVEHYYLPHARTKKRSWELDQRMLRLHILQTFGHRKMEHVRRMEIMNWQNALLGKGLAPGTCNRVFVLLKSIFNCAIRWGVLAYEKNPCRGVTPFEDSSLKERYLSPDEARRLLDALRGSRLRQCALAIQLLLFTGARKNEILSARWEHVDWERRLLTVPLSKSGKARHIPLSDEAMRILQSIPRHKDTPWVFPGKGTNSHLRSVARLWDDVRERLALHDVRLHDLRHSFASFLVNSGCSLYEVQRCLGHYDPKVTMRYAHLAPQSLVRAANMVGQSMMQ